uniref:Uncharacterized protein n=1 Tax=Daphnia galeata TaxID=27404 RepID=A0A8J2RRP3_9CRUS|nr:unnamed protein product [Daphnia galeata]
MDNTQFWRNILLYGSYIVFAWTFFLDNGNIFEGLNVVSTVAGVLIWVIGYFYPPQTPDRGSFMYRMLINVASYFAPAPRPKSKAEFFQECLTAVVKYIAFLKVLNRGVNLIKG